jgi:DNA-binding CsgD family transcriptional regulator
VSHLKLLFYLLALLAGAASLAQTFLIQQRYRKAVIRRYGLFLLSLFLLLLGFSVQLYARIAGWQGAAAAGHAVWILFAAGGLSFIFWAPPFYHSLLGLPFGGWVRVVFFCLDVLAAAAALANLLLPAWTFTGVALNLLLFALVLYGLVLIAANLAKVGEKVLRRALTLFFVVSLAFFPLMYVDSAMAYLPALAGLAGLAGLAFLEGLAQPLYFLVLNVLTILFGLRYLNRPAYAENNRLTAHFLSTFQVTRREQEIILLLLEGAGGREIGTRLFISPKTVENHIYNIYQKLGVNSRVQLYRLIRANALD